MFDFKSEGGIHTKYNSVHFKLNHEMVFFNTQHNILAKV